MSNVKRLREAVQEMLGDGYMVSRLPRCKISAGLWNAICRELLDNERIIVGPANGYPQSATIDGVAVAVDPRLANNDMGFYFFDSPFQQAVEEMAAIAEGTANAQTATDRSHGPVRQR